MSTEKVAKVLPGLLLVIVVGYLAYLIAGLSLWLDALVVGVVLGIIIRTVMGNREVFNPGMAFARLIFIQAGLILYGVKLDFVKIFNINPAVLALVVLVQLAVFAVIMWTSRRMELDEKTGLLLGAGTAICGASAIAVTAPCVEGESKDVSIALVVITILGAIGTIIYVLFAPLGLSDNQYAVLCATTLHQTGFVKTAALSVSEIVKEAALSIKLFRTAMLAVIAVILGYRQSKITERETGQKTAFPIPWFVVAFVAVGILVSAGVPLNYGKYASTAATIVFTMALTAVGMDVNWLAFRYAGLRPLWVGLLGWLTAILVAFIGILLVVG
ncbi:MAG TPA: putative sulfate exporter family transporter [Anaerolineae bacterium]|nr:putative sulfate exporter family transporter [Anaerolineae bacterium]